MSRFTLSRITFYHFLLLTAAFLAGAAFFTGTAFALAARPDGVRALVGALLFGPDALLSGAAAQDAGGTDAAGTATGLVNGVGSVGGMLEGLTLPALSAHFGWQVMFPLLAALAVCAALALIPALRRIDTRIGEV